MKTSTQKAWNNLVIAAHHCVTQKGGIPDKEYINAVNEMNHACTQEGGIRTNISPEEVLCAIQHE